MDQESDTKTFRRMCNLCDAHFYTEKEYITHYAMSFHKFMTTLKKTQQTYIGNGKTLSEQITETGKREPLVGLEYIYEYAEDSQGVRMYECKLCNSAYKSDSIFFHVVGIQHRVLYLARHHPIMGIDSGFEVLQQGQYRKLANNALAIEQTHGRKKINFVNEVYVSKPDVCEVSDTESIPEIPEEIAKEVSEISEDSKPPRKMSKSKKARKERRARERLLKLQEEAEAQEKAEDGNVRSWQQDREPESQRDSREKPRPLLQDDFDAKPLQRARSPLFQYDRKDDTRNKERDGEYYSQSRYRDVGSVYHSDNRDNPKYQQDTVGDMTWQYKTGYGTDLLSDTRVGSLPSRSIGNIPSYQQERPFPPATEVVPPVNATLPLVGGGSTTYPLVGGASTTYPLVGGGSNALPLDGGGSSTLPLVTYPPVRSSSTTYPPVGSGTTTLPPVSSLGSTFQDDFDDVDLRVVNPDHDKPSVIREKGDSPNRKSSRSDSRSTSRKGSSSTSASTKDQSRRRKYSTDSRSRSHRHEKRDRNCEDVDVRSALPPGGVSFKELREAYQKNPNIVFSSENLPLCKKKNEDKETDSDMEVCSMEFSDCEPDEFWNNEEMFDFLKFFYIDNEDDVKFVLEAIKQMSEALVRYKTRKQDLQNRIFAEKERLETEKKVFSEIKKRKEDWIIAGIKPKKRVKPEENATQQETDSQASGTAPADQKPKETVTKPPQGSSSQKTKGQQAAQKPKEKITTPEQVITSARAIVAGIAPLLQQLFKKCQDPDFRPNQNLGSPLDMKAPVDGTRPDPHRLSNQNPGSRFDTRGPGAALGPASEKRFSQNQQIPGSMFNNPYPSKEQTPLPGQGTGRYSGGETHFNQNQPPASRFENPDLSKDLRPLMGPGAGRYSEPGSRFNQNEQFPGPRIDSSGSLDKIKPLLGAGSETHFRQIPGSRFDNTDPSKDSRHLMGQGAGKYSEPGSHYKQNDPFPGSRIDNSLYPDKTKLLPGAGPETHFSHSQGISGSRYDDPGPSKEARPLVGQGAGRYSEPDSHYKQNEPFPGPHDKTKPPPGAGFDQTRGISGTRLDNLGPSKEHRPLMGQGAGRYSEPDSHYKQNEKFPGPYDKTKPLPGAGFNQTQGIYGTRFDNLGPSKEPRPLMGQGAGRYSEPDSHYKQNDKFPGSRVDNSLYPDKTKPLSGAGFNPAQGISDTRYDNLGPSKEPRAMFGQGEGRYSEPDSHYKQNEKFPGSWDDNSLYPDKSKALPGAGFNQTQGISGSRFDNPGPSKDARPLVGQGAGRYSESDSHYKQNEQFPGSRVDNSGYYDKTKPLPGAGFNQTQGNSGSTFNNPSPSKEPRPLLGQGAGSYSDTGSRFKQNEQFPGSWSANSGFLNNTKPPIDADMEAKYKQTQWNSGPKTGNQGFYNDARTATGSGGGRYGEQYTQNQWQSQTNSKAAPSEAKPEPGSQTYQPTGSQTYQPTGHQSYQPSGPQSHQPTGPQSYQPSGSQSYQPAGSQSYQPAGSQSYQPAGSQSYQPAGSQSYQPAGSQSYQPAGSQSYQPAGSQSYQPAGSQSYQPAGSQSYQPAGAQSYQPAGAQSYQPAGAQSYQPAGAQSYQPAGAQSYQAAGAQSYQAAGAQSYQAAGAQSYQAAGAQSYQPKDSTKFPSERQQGNLDSQDPAKAPAYPRSILKNKTTNLP